MADLYLLFFIFGLLLFGGVVGYSYLQNYRKKATDRSAKELRSHSSERKTTVESSVKDASDSNPAVSPTKASGPQKNETKSEPSSSNSPLVDEFMVAADGHEQKNIATQAAQKPKSIERESSKAGALSRAKAAISSATKAKLKGGAKSDAQKPSSSKPSQRKLEPSVTDEPTQEGEFKLITSGDERNTVVTDMVAKVMNPSPIEQSELLSLFREHDFKFHRKVNIYGLNELTDMWRDIEFELPTARFLELGISVQLCDREGAMTEKEAHDFQQMVLRFCEKYDAPFEFSMQIEDALKQAQALDQFGRRYDCMAVLNVVPKVKSGFRIADIQSCARDLMMSSDKNGIFMKTEGQKNNITVLYRLACTDGEGHFGVQMAGQKTSTPVHDLVVYMNVPATRDPEAVFQQMVKDANDLATWLDGKVVDRSGKTMTQRTYTTLMQQISDIAYSMQQDGLVPGDPVSKKLF